MKVKVSDYIADYFSKQGLSQVFTVFGGGSMHLNDSFGHDDRYNCIYNHHEQALAIAGESYARIAGKPAIVCVTSGPGAINAFNGVTGAYQDSIPMIVLSGQTKTTLTMRYNNLHLRTLGNQEFDVSESVSEMTKYVEMVMDPIDIAYVIEKAYHLAITGRPGPCWIDIPLDIQGAIIETDDLKHFIPDVSESNEMTDEELDIIADKVVDRFISSERPVLYAGNGIRISGCVDQFHKLVEMMQIPVVTCWDSIDLMATDDDLYCGRGGNMGDRAGNFAVQNSDFLLCIGTRLNIYQVGFDVNTWAREAYIIVDDIDPEELKKKTMRADLPVCADAGRFIMALQKKLASKDVIKRTWCDQCITWKNKYPVVTEKQKEQKGLVNVYAFIDSLSRSLPENSITVVANGSASVVGSAAYYIKETDRFIMNCALSSMGYDLPGAIGACAANDRKQVICIAGDGSMQMNLQELATISFNRLPIKIFVINNGGYHQVRLTERNVFKGRLCGVGPESGDLGFPDFKLLSAAYDIKYYIANSNADLGKSIEAALKEEGPTLCEICVDTDQKFEPKSATKILPNGKPVSPPLEDMAPFLSEEELKENMYISMISSDFR